MPLGIEHLKAALQFVADFTDQVSRTKKFNLLSAFSFVDELIELGAVIQSWKDIVAEFNDLDDSERAELHQYAKDVLKISPDKAKDFVADAFNWALLTFSLVQRRKDLKK